MLNFFQLVALSGKPKIKLSQEVSKITIPGKKKIFRIFGKGGFCILDLMTLDSEKEPQEGEAVLCRHPFEVFLS